MKKTHPILYYTDALKATLMAQEFGVRYIHKDLPDGFHPSTAYWADVLVRENLLPIYIHQDSLHIFEPQEGDMIDKSSCSINEFKYMEFTSVENLNTFINPPNDTESFTETGCKIIQRNNTAFFQPKIEDDVS